MKKSELTLEMVALFLLAIAFAVVVIFLIIKNRDYLEKLFRIITGLP
jgi:uncharacterized protein YoxC